MFTSQWLFGGDELNDVKKIRHAVFVDEYGIAPAEEFDNYDAYAAHILISLDNGDLIATGRIYPDGDSLLIDRIAVMPAYRSLPYDDLVLRMLMYRAQDLPQTYIRLMVREKDSRAFMYSRFGFCETGNVKEYRNGRYSELSLRRDSIIWDSDCKHEN